MVSNDMETFPHVMGLAGMLMTFQSWRSSTWGGRNFGTRNATKVLLCRSAVRPFGFGKLTAKECKNWINLQEAWQIELSDYTHYQTR